jgi:uncharacterized phage protein (TIGR02218 family)
MTTYADREASIDASEPIEFYDFTRESNGTVEHWRHVTSTQNLTFNGDLYGAMPGLQRSAVQATGETTSMQCTLTLPREACVVGELRGRLSAAPILVTITRAQRGLADSETATIFRGELSDPKFEGSTCEVTCSSNESKWNQNLCRVFVQRTCPLMLYEPQCGADKAAVTFSGIVTAVADAGATLTVDEISTPEDHMGADSTFYQSGFLAVGSVNVFITQQVAHVLSLQQPVDVAIGDTVVITAGCDRQLMTCDERHRNVDRFGGFPLMPESNPWNGIA